MDSLQKELGRSLLGGSFSTASMEVSGSKGEATRPGRNDKNKCLFLSFLPVCVVLRFALLTSMDPYQLAQLSTLFQQQTLLLTGE